MNISALFPHLYKAVPFTVATTSSYNLFFLFYNILCKEGVGSFIKEIENFNTQKEPNRYFILTKSPLVVR